MPAAKSSTGSKIGFLTANVAYAPARDDIAPDFRAQVKQLIEKN